MPPVPSQQASKLDPYKAKIREWLAKDQNCWHKQQHTAKRILDRLRFGDCNKLCVNRIDELFLLD